MRILLLCISLLGAASAFQAAAPRISCVAFHRPTTVILHAIDLESSLDKSNRQNRIVKDEDQLILANEQKVVWSAAELQSVLTAAFLTTGNTVGAGTLVLPELAARPGFALSTGVFAGAYMVNLLSGLLLLEVAISQHEFAEEGDAPSSFREFAQASLGSPDIANAISCISLFVNTCALTFTSGKAGVLLSDISGGSADHVVLSTAFSALLVLLGTTFSRERISQVSSVFVAALFGSVSTLLVSGLPQVTDPMATILTPGTSANIVQGMAETAPIMLTTLIFQNIVPPVTKILGYDRTKSIVALVLGSFLPLALYLSWSFTVLGGGVPAAVGMESPVLTAFSVAAVTGSAIGCTMAASEELQAFLPSDDTDEAKVVQDKKSGGYALPAVLAAVMVPLVASSMMENYSDALKLSGGYGIPILYGAIPVLMATTQRENTSGQVENILPGGATWVVGAAFGAFMLNSIFTDMDRFLSV